MSESLRTKRGLGTALIQLCSEKDFNRVNVTDIAHTCGVNRQTFYYHFTDKYDLLLWVYEEQSLHYLNRSVTLENWQECVYLLLEQMKEQPQFYIRTVRADPTILEQRFEALTQELFLALFAKEAKEAVDIMPSDRLFYAEFFSYGCAGVLLKWIRNGMREPAATITAQLTRLAHDVSFFVQRIEENHPSDLDNLADLSKN